MAVSKEWKTAHQKFTTCPSRCVLFACLFPEIVASVLCSISNVTTIILCTLACCGIFFFNVNKGLLCTWAKSRTVTALKVPHSTSSVV